MTVNEDPRGAVERSYRELRDALRELAALHGVDVQSDYRAMYELTRRGEVTAELFEAYERLRLVYAAITGLSAAPAPEAADAFVAAVQKTSHVLSRLADRRRAA